VKKVLALLLAAVIGFGISEAMHRLASAIDRSKAKRNVADARAMSERLERYRAEHSAYPVGCDPMTLKSQFASANITSSGSDEPWIHYCSDGRQYLMAFVPSGGGEFNGLIGAPVVAANGRLVAWAQTDGR
jgi:type II secretory pathway pseudopilin PulG